MENNSYCDFVFIYSGLTRSIKQTYESQFKYIYNELDKHNLSYKKIMHTWKTKTDKLEVRHLISEDIVDYSDYKLLQPDYYKIDDQEEFHKTIQFSDYFDEKIWLEKGESCHGEHIPWMVLHQIFALESRKRGFEMLEQSGIKCKYVVFLRPECLIFHELPILEIIHNPDPNKIIFCDFNHFDGYNDSFAIMHLNNAILYGKKVDELKDYRKNIGRVAIERYVKYIVEKYNMSVYQIPFKFDIARPYPIDTFLDHDQYRLRNIPKQINNEL